MFKLIALALGLAIGFGGGVWYSAKHPEWAKDFAAKEEQHFLETQLRIAKSMRAKLDQITAREAAGKAPGGTSSFLGGGARKPDPELTQLSQEQDVQINELEKKLAEAKK